MALRGKQVHGFAKRRYGGGILLLIEKQHAEIEIRLGHFWVDGDDACVFGAGFVSSFQGRVDIRKLKVRVSKFGLVGNDFLQRCNGRLKITFVDVALGFIEKVVKGVRHSLGLRLHDGVGFGGLGARRGLVGEQERSILRPYKEKDARQKKESPNHMRTETIELYGSDGGILAPLEIAVAGPVDFDAPFAERFA